MKRGIADTQPVAAHDRVRMMRLQAHRSVGGRNEDRAVRRAEVLDEELAAVIPNARMTPRDLCLRIEARKIDLGEDIRLRITAADDVVALFEREHGRLQFARSVDDQS